MATDVNQELFDKRRAAIDNGRVTRRDDGSWVYADKAEVFGREGLDMSLGEAALYTTTPAWHGLGNVVPGGTSDVDEVLKLGGIDFQVELRAVRYSFDGALQEVEDRYVTVRDDTGAALGVVGSRYTPIQNRAAFEFLQDLVETTDVTWESAGALRDGRSVFVSMQLPDLVTIDAEGINDQVVPFVAALNSHDGSSPFRVVVTPWRPVCANTERFAVRDAYTKWTVRHTASAADRIAEARRTLGLSMKYYEQYGVEETALARTDMAIDEFRKVVDELWPVDEDATDRTKKKAEDRFGDLAYLFEVESGRVGRTAYAAEQAVTGYLDHIAPRRPGKTLTEELARATAVMEGADDEVKSRTHRLLMARTTG